MAPRYHLLCALHFLVFLQTKVICYEYKVGDLDAWGIPTSSHSKIYDNWAKKHQFKIGDSLLFLYPPSQDSVIQLTEQAFNSCNTSDPLLYMHDGNSIFNFTSPGKFYFTSGVARHCQKSQKLEVNVALANGSLLSPSSAPSMLPATSPSYTPVFGSIPSSSSMLLVSIAAVVGPVVGMIL